VGRPWITRRLADGKPALYYRAPVPGGVLFAMKRGIGPRALLLHGGPGMGAESALGLLDELIDTVEGVLPQQRGLEPSVVAGSRDIETHVADEIALLDFLGWDEAWLIGHDWGGLLAMHIAVAHPERVTGLILIGTLGAIPDGGSGALVENLVARLTPEERARLDPLVARQAAGDDDPNLWAEIMAILWPSYYHDHRLRPVELPRIETPVDGEPATIVSIASHFEAGTLVDGLPSYSGPALFLHGDDDPLPSRVATETAALITGARVEILEATGHYPWFERPGVVRDAVTRFLADATPNQTSAEVDD
jgi:pimeloyl-ACP methyl ester carboxylesterase